MSAATTTADAPADQPLLSVTWTDLGSLPFAPGEPTTIDQAYTDYLTAQWRDAYQQTLDALLQEDDGAVYTLAVAEDIAHQAAITASDRLNEYASRLRVFLETQPSEDDLVTWLADRAMSDAGVWARGDALEMRRQAQHDYYQVNPKQGKFRIAPDSAAEPKCSAIAGNVYDSQNEAESALGEVWHRNCIHYVEPAAA